MMTSTVYALCKYADLQMNRLFAVPERSDAVPATHDVLPSLR